MRMYSLLSILLTVVVVGAFAGPQGGPPPPPDLENLPEECRPKRPEPGQQREECCQLPRPSKDLMDQKFTYRRECADMLGVTLPGPPPSGDGSRPPGPPPSGEGGKPPGPPGGRQIACFEECVVNKLGFLTGEMQLDSATVTTKAIEEFGSDPAWTPIVEEAARNCLASAAGDVSPNDTCRSGAAQFRKCLMRTLYLNCPSGLVNNSESCAAERGTVERCPNLMPPPPPPPMGN